MTPGDDRGGGHIERALGLDAAAFAALVGTFTRLNRPRIAAIVERMNGGAPAWETLGLPREAIGELYRRAFAAFNAGHTGRAEELFRALCTLAGDVADHWLGYGICLRMREARMHARDAFLMAAALRPGWGVPHFHLAELHLAEGDDARAAEAVAAAEADAANLPERMAGELARYRIALERRRAGEPGAR